MACTTGLFSSYDSQQTNQKCVTNWYSTLSTVTVSHWIITPRVTRCTCTLCQATILNLVHVPPVPISSLRGSQCTTTQDPRMVMIWLLRVDFFFFLLYCIVFGPSSSVEEKKEQDISTWLFWETPEVAKGREKSSELGWGGLLVPWRVLFKMLSNVVLGGGGSLLYRDSLSILHGERGPSEERSLPQCCIPKPGGRQPY